MMVSNVKGEFTAVTGKLELNSADITKSRIEASIDAATINTREPQRDAHLKYADFLDVERSPLTFKSTRVSKVASTEPEEGDLTIHGVTRNEKKKKRKTHRRDQRSVGQHSNRDFGHNAHRPEGFWLNLERNTRGRRHHGGARRDDHARCRVRKGVTLVRVYSTETASNRAPDLVLPHRCVRC